MIRHADDGAHEQARPRERAAMGMGPGHHTSRRAFLAQATVAGAVGLGAWRPPAVAAEPPPETTTIRLGGSRSLCFAPQYVAEELLRAEGFTAVQYVPSEPAAEAMARGELDLSIGLGANFVLRVDAGQPLVILSGVTSDASSCSSRAPSAP